MTTRAQRAAILRPGPGVGHAYTPEQRAHFTETDWNWHYRKALQAQGFRALHIREASDVGVADLIVYRNCMTQSGAIELHQVIEAWIELKVQDPGRDLLGLINPGQKEFLRNHWRFGRNALIATYVRKTDMIEVRQGDLRGRVKVYPADPYAIDWKEVFAHFKARKVSL